MKRMLPRVLDIVRQYQTNDPHELCKLMNIIVKRVNLHGATKGFALKLFDSEIIYIEKNLSRNESNVVLAHELAHVILHGFGKRGFAVHIPKDKATDKKELEAHKFAFLLIAHTCLRNEPIMIDSIRDEKLLTFDDIVKLLNIFVQNGCYI